VTTGLDALASGQRRLVTSWLPGVRVVRDHSWGLVGTVVLEVEHAGERYVVKAADEHDHHLDRELRAHREWLEPWASRGRGPSLVRADAGAKVLVTRFLPGVLAQGTPAEHEPETYRQAGALLALLHAQPGTVDDAYEERLRDKTLAVLDKPHRIPPDVETRLREEVGSWPTPPSTLVPTHGDWQPRNWLWDDGVVRVIDLGRADLRPAASDLVRLAAQQWRGRPELEAAFLEGYGGDPRDPGAWRRLRVAEAVGTAVWAYGVGDAPFEQQGHRMIGDVLDNA
jgi:Ser/Thr protein kinase RdoA (MazF antagonist)